MKILRRKSEKPIQNNFCRNWKVTAHGCCNLPFATRHVAAALLALEFMITEHQNIDTLKAKLFGDAIAFTDVENSILENNLYGVDINEEATDIAKLSLWLRTARKGRKLNTLSNHIKCGNSLIDDAEIAGDKAFNWQQEFPEVFEKGGFDVAIGNPPYVPSKTIAHNEKEYFYKHYSTVEYQINTFTLFIEKTLSLISNSGKLA